MLGRGRGSGGIGGLRKSRGATGDDEEDLVDDLAVVAYLSEATALLATPDAVEEDDDDDKDKDLFSYDDTHAKFESLRAVKIARHIRETGSSCATEIDSSITHHVGDPSEEIVDAMLEHELKTVFGLDAASDHPDDFDYERADLLLLAPNDEHRAWQRAWADNIHKNLKAIKYVNHDECKTPRELYISLVEYSAAGAETSDQLRWVHWDSLDNPAATRPYTGRFVKVETILGVPRLAYAPPSKKASFLDDIGTGRMRFVVPNCRIQMVRATGQFCADIPHELLAIRGMFSSLERSEAGASLTDMCSICHKFFTSGLSPSCLDHCVT